MHKEAIEKVMDSKVGQEPGVRRACQVLLGVRAGSQREALRVVQDANLALFTLDVTDAMAIARKPTRAEAPTEKAEAEKVEAEKAPKTPKEAAPKAAASVTAPPAEPEPAPKKRAKPTKTTPTAKAD